MASGRALKDTMAYRDRNSPQHAGGQRNTDSASGPFWAYMARPAWPASSRAAIVLGSGGGGVSTNASVLSQLRNWLNCRR